MHSEMRTCHIAILNSSSCSDRKDLFSFVEGLELVNIYLAEQKGQSSSEKADIAFNSVPEAKSHFYN